MHKEERLSSYIMKLFLCIELIMSLKTLPILFLNLGGEMVYILDQRLRAQSIPTEKAKKGLYIVTIYKYLYK